MFSQKKSLENARAVEAQSTKANRPKMVHTPHGTTHEVHLKAYHKPIFSWTAPEYIQHEKGPRWYFISAALVLISSILSIVLAKNWTFALAIIVCSALYYYLQRKHEPQDVPVTVSDIGIRVGNIVYPFTHIQAFWIIYHPPHVRTLNLRINKRFFNEVAIHLEDHDPVELRNFLCGQIPEWEGRNEHFSDVILRILKL